MGPNSENLVIANEGGSRHFTANYRIHEWVSNIVCNNAIDPKTFDHWTVTLSVSSAAPGTLTVYKNGEKLDCGR